MREKDLLQIIVDNYRRKSQKFVKDEARKAAARARKDQISKSRAMNVLAQWSYLTKFEDRAIEKSFQNFLRILKFKHL